MILKTTACCAALLLSFAPLLRAQEAQAPQQPELIRSMQQVEDGWGDAITKRDQYALENALAPSFVDISASGEVTTRNQQIAALFAKDNSTQSLEQKVVSVRTFGEVALVNGTYVRTYRENGRNLEEKGVFSHVFQRVRGNWQCINSQRTIVVTRAAGKTSAKGSKSSDQPKKTSKAELPFHIPLIHKGDQPAPPAPAPQQPQTPQQQ